MPPTRNALEGSSWFLQRGVYHVPLLLGEFPHEVPFGFLGSVLPTSVPAELRFQAHRIPPEAATELLHTAGVVAQAELAAGSGGVGARRAQLELEAESATDMARQVSAREQELWRLGLSLHALGRERGRTERLRADLVRNLQALGFRTRAPQYESFDVVKPPNLRGSESRPLGYWHTIHTDGLAAFFPFQDELVAEPKGILAGLLLEDATPVFLDRWSHASYSWAVFGSTGSGKTFTAALWALRTWWMRPELDLIFVDPLGEFAGFTRALGGSVVPLRTSEYGRLNPLDPATTGGDLEEKASRVGMMLTALFPSLRDEEAAALDTAVRPLLAKVGTTPTWSDLFDEVVRRAPGERLPSLLEVFRSGSLRHLNGPTTLGWDRSPICFELSGVPQHQLPFYLAFSLDALYARIRCRSGPKLVIIDEAHLLTRDPRTAEFLERLVRLVRHFETGMVLISQNPDDFVVHESGRAMSRNFRATMLLRVLGVSSATREFFGLTEDEVEWLPRARLPREAGYAEGLLRFGPAHLPLAIVASTPEHEFLLGVLKTVPSSTGDRSVGDGTAAPTARL